MTSATASARVRRISTSSHGASGLWYGEVTVRQSSTTRAAAGPLARIGLLVRRLEEVHVHRRAVALRQLGDGLEGAVGEPVQVRRRELRAHKPIVAMPVE